MAEDLTSNERAVLHDIVTALKSNGQFVVHLDDGDERIETVRSLGRRAGRQLGWKVRTFATDPTHRDDHKVVVIVAVTDSNPLHQQLMQVRGDKALRRAFESWDLGGQDG